MYISCINTYALYFWLCGCFLTLCLWSEMIAMFYIQRVIITSQLYCHTVCLPEREDEVGRGVASLHLKWSLTAPWKCKDFFRDTFKLKQAFKGYSKKTSSWNKCTVHVLWAEVYLFFCEDDSAQQLVLQSPHGDSEVDDGGASADFRGVGWVRQLGGHVEPKALHHVHLLVSNFHLQT